MPFNFDAPAPSWESRIDGRFTSLRGYAALTVVLAHYQTSDFPFDLPMYRFAGQFGLFLFFFLSAFLLSHSLFLAARTTHPVVALVKYATNRIFRIFPLLIAVVMFACWREVAFFPPGTRYTDAIVNALTLGVAPSILWTIPVELVFYGYLPVVLVACLWLASRRRGPQLLAAGFIIWCAAIAYAAHTSPAHPAWMTLGFHWYANSFVGGVGLYAILRNLTVQLPARTPLYLSLAPLVFLLAHPFFYASVVPGDFKLQTLTDPGAWSRFYNHIYPWAPIIVAAMFVELLSPAESALSRFLRLPVLKKIGDVSFGAYLTHMPVLLIIKAHFGAGQWQFFAALVATFAVAMLLHEIIEKPAISAGRAIGRAATRLPVHRLRVSILTK